MPLRDVVCQSCRDEREEILKNGEEPSCCEVCGGERTAKPFGKTNFKLVGGCWASDGYSSASAKAKEIGK